MNDERERGLLGGVLQREAARWWWVPLVAAVAWFLIAWLVLRANYTSLATVGVLLGFAFLMAAINEGALGVVTRGGWAILHYALSVLFVVGAIWAFVHPVNSFFALASILGLLLFLQGIFTLTRGLALRDESPYWWLDATAGGLLTRSPSGSPRPTARGTWQTARTSSCCGWGSWRSSGGSRTPRWPSRCGGSPRRTSPHRGAPPVCHSPRSRATAPASERSRAHARTAG